MSRQFPNSLPGLNYQFSDPALLAQALTHRSFSAHNYERLEFLGDGLVNFVVARLIYQQRPDAAEGDLSRMRARLVRGDTLANIATELNLGDHLRLGEGELKSGGHRRKSILADAFEALTAAVYLDSDFATVEALLTELFIDRVHALPDAEALKDPKTRLQEWLQGRALPLPDYQVVEESGADHAKLFRVVCGLQKPQKSFAAEGRSRRKAEQAAATLALAQLEER